MSLQVIVWYVQCIVWYYIGSPLYGPNCQIITNFGVKNAYYLHGIVWYCKKLHCILWYCTVLHVTAWYCMVWYCLEFSQYCNVLYGIALLRMVSVLHYGIWLHCMELCTIALYSMILNGNAWYCMVPHCTSSNHALLYGIALYHYWLLCAGCISQDAYLLYHKKERAAFPHPGLTRIKSFDENIGADLVNMLCAKFWSNLMTL